MRKQMREDLRKKVIHFIIKAKRTRKYWSIRKPKFRD